MLKVYRGDTLPVSGLDPDLTALIDQLERVEPSGRPSSEETADRLRWILDKPDRARRKRWRTAVAAAFAAVVVVAAGAATYSHLRAERRAAIAQRFAHEASTIEWLMRAEHLSPPHDIRPAKQQVRQRMAKLAASMQELGDAAAGPGLYALGRGEMALGDFAAARESLEGAWKHGHQLPEVAYAIGITLGELYREGLEASRRIADPGRRAARIEELNRDLRDRALDFLGRCRDTEVAYPRYVEGLLALYEERFEDGLAAAKQLSEAVPWFHEADLLEGWLLQRLASRADDLDRDSARHEELSLRARDALQRAAEKGRSDPRVHLALCHVDTKLGEAAVYSDRRLVAPARVEKAFDTCRRALELDSSLAEAHRITAGLFTLRATIDHWEGGDPSESYRLATEASGRAIDLEPTNPRGYVFRGWVNLRRGYTALERGQDPRVPLGLAIEDLSRLEELEPANLGPLAMLGDACWLRGHYEIGHGGDPTAWLDRGVDSLRRAVASSPENGTLWIVLGNLLWVRGRWETGRGADAAASLEEAVNCFRRGAEGASGPTEYINLANAHLASGRFGMSRGQDPSDSFQAALSAASTAIEINPEYGWAHLLAGNAHAALAQYQHLGGREPEAAVERALAAYESARSLAPDQVGGWTEPAFLHLQLARWQVEQGRSPAAHLAAARSLLTEGGRQEDSLEYLPVVGELELVEARQRLEGGRRPESNLQEAVRALTAAVEQNANDAYCFGLIAEAHLLRARWKRRLGDEIAGELREGLAAAARALEVNPRLAEAEAIRAELYHLQGEASEGPESRREALERGSAALRRALELKPLLSRRYRELAASLL